MDYTVVLFYRYVFITDVEYLCKCLKIECKKHSLLGRILIAEEGINGTLAGAEECIALFVEYLKSDDRFKMVDWKFSRGFGSRLPFPDLFIKSVKEIVSCGSARSHINEKVTFNADSFGGLGGTGIHLTPADFHQALKTDSTAVIIDVRNNYEYVI